MCKTIRRTLCAHVALTLILLAAAASRAGVLDGLGAIGAGSASNAPTNYPGLMQTYRGVNFGGVGIPYAFGHVGSDSLSILSPGNQVDQAVTQIQAGNITLVTIGIGDNDYIDVAGDIASGALSGAALTGYEAQVAGNIANAVNTLHSAGAAVVLGGFADILDSPAIASIKADLVGAQRLESALADGRALVRSFANANGIPFIEFFQLQKDVYDSGVAQVGGVNLILNGYGSDPHYFFEDPYHAGIVVRGAITDLFIQAINDGYGTNIPLLSDLDILTVAGLQDEYVGETFNSMYAYHSFVTVPEPSSVLLAVIGVAVLVGCRWRRRIQR